MEAIDEKGKFIKQVPVHPKDRLKRTDKQLRHSKNKEGQIARFNVSKLMRDEFDFNPKKRKKNKLNKTLILDTEKNK